MQVFSVDTTLKRCYTLSMKLVKFALKQFGINPKVKIRYKDMKHYAHVKPTKKGYKLVISTRYDIDPVVIFHECTHIMQYELKGLVFTKDIMMFDGEQHHGTDYWWYPWEIEARGYEQALYQRWLCTQKKKKKRLKIIQQEQSKTLHKESESLQDQ